MAYKLVSWPESAFAKECADLPPDAAEKVDVVAHRLRTIGPRLDEFRAESLGIKWNGMWRLRFKENREQIRLVYKPYGKELIAIFKTFKKTSAQGEKRAYEVALQRCKDFENYRKGAKRETTYH